MGVTTHGMSNTPTYWVWNDIKKRCCNPKNQAYKNYGGRGITLCVRWHNFLNFLSDMGEKPKGKTIERENNNEGYTPDNCTWASSRDQHRNTRRTRLIAFGNKTQCLSDWEKELGLSVGALSYRLKQKWPLEKALTRQHHSRHENTQLNSKGYIS